ncbi:Ribosomal RNA-processing 1 [Lecanosticta acicola]|uniref:Ribosomal RNA-processing 1 n=1 Tax=Lecanosticta acicola TaxID=111012 RepID=A0AAI8Z6R8_9PEZI|nr:Ribosomal RNA-processing 1 [Lecanosticta acicola]
MASIKTTASSQHNSPFIKQLASSNPTHRRQALSSLRTYLSHPARDLSNLETLKLWKGLFYSMYMCDKPRNQQTLARDLADLVDTLKSAEAKSSFLSGFWTIMAREWGNIDYLRMDKYLYLVRCMVKKGFEVVAKEKDTVDAYNEMISGDGGALSPRDAKVPVGLRLHVLDVWVDELERVLDGEDGVVEKMMQPVKKLGKESLVKSVRDRAKETVGDERLADEGKRWRTEGEAADGKEDNAEEDRDNFGGFDD